MADLAVGISKTAVQLLADKVKSAIKEEAEQWQTLQQNLVFITGEFEMMQSFLNSADGEHVKSHVVRTWVRQVRDLSYDVEDCIEFVLHLDTERSWWLRLLPSCSCSCTEGSELPLDEAVTQIKQLKIRVDDVSQRNLRYRFGDSGSEPLTQQQFVSTSAIGAPGFDIVFAAKDTAARFRRGIDLNKLVTEGSNNDLRVISLWGTGDDLGTMSVIRNMYDDPKICRNFRCRAWVKVMHPVNPSDLIRSLVVQFYANSCHQHGETVSTDLQTWFCRLKLKKRRDALSWTETSAGDLVQEFVRLVNTHKYLIILEDLSTVVQWDAIRPYLRDSKNGSCIVVSTRHHEIASLCTGKPYQVSEIQRFSGNQTIRVFFNAGFKDARVITVEREPALLRWLSVNRLVGRDSEVEKLSNLIMIKDRHSTHKPHVVSVWGIPGSGRTEVVTNVCCRCYAEPGSDWYKMVILSGFSESSFQAENPPIDKCREFLQEYPCLVVIDDMPSKEFWDSIKVENMISSKSCIVVITTEESVAIHCAGSDDFVCSIRCLQPMAAFDLFQQEFQKQASQKDRDSSEEQTFPTRRKSFEEFAFNYFFGPDRQDEYTFQNNEDEAFQNNGNTLEEQAYQNQENTAAEQAFQNKGNSSGKHVFLNSGGTLEEQAYQNQENTIVEEAFQNNGNSSGEQALQNGNSFKEQALQSNGNSSCTKGKMIIEQPVQNNENSIEEQALQSNGNSCTNGDTIKEQPFQNNGNSVNEQAFQNDRDLLEEEILRYNGTSSFEQEFWSLFETNKQEEHALENKGSTFEELACYNSGSLFEGQAFQNSENSFEEQQNSEDILSFQSKGNFRQICQSEIDKKYVSMSPNDPNIKALVSRSGGFPQVIVALGRYLAKRRLSNVGTWEWQCQHLIGNFMQELQTNQDFYCLRSLLAWMHSYFRSSPSLMRCMLYLSIFPREQTFQRRRLVRRWIAEGYAKGTESSSSEEFADQLFDKFTCQSVMRQVTPTNMETSRYEVNGFFHEYMISRPVEERLFFPLEVSVLEERYCRVTTEGVGQHLAIWNSWDRNKIAYDSLDFLRLRSLTVFGRWEPFFISDKMRVLRVLDLENACGVSDKDVEQIGKVLLRLKFLSLRACKEITRIPDSLGGLRQLQTLDIWKTSVATLVSITKLKKLQYLRAGTTSVPLGDHTTTPSPEAAADPSLSTPSTSGPRAPSPTLESLFHVPESWTLRNQRLPDSRNGGVVVPRRIGQMTALHTLRVIDVSVASGRATLQGLKNLAQLRKLGVSGVNRENCQDLCSAISCHTYLESLSVWFDKGMNRAICLDAISSPPAQLQSLKLYGYVEIMPPWIKDLRKLMKLSLELTTSKREDLVTIGKLEKLHTLRLHVNKVEDAELRFHAGPDDDSDHSSSRLFLGLKVLEIACTNCLHVMFAEGAMKRLELLTVHSCNQPSLQLSGLENLVLLHEVSFKGSYDNKLKEALQQQLDKHPKKPALKLERPSSS
ncbi:unnamed protein product [Urochloa decumbens]|uniref:Uncharacterized protein n=1 Tax=Urochloa decumbens TaxID=240449 RepID=A0ABC9B0S4_9POAL